MQLTDEQYKFNLDFIEKFKKSDDFGKEFWLFFENTSNATSGYLFYTITQKGEIELDTNVYKTKRKPMSNKKLHTYTLTIWYRDKYFEKEYMERDVIAESDEKAIELGKAFKRSAFSIKIDKKVPYEVR